MSNFNIKQSFNDVIEGKNKFLRATKLSLLVCVIIKKKKQGYYNFSTLSIVK